MRTSTWVGERLDISQSGMRLAFAELIKVIDRKAGQYLFAAGGPLDLDLFDGASLAKADVLLEGRIAETGAGIYGVVDASFLKHDANTRSNGRTV